MSEERPQSSPVNSLLMGLACVAAAAGMATAADNQSIPRLISAVRGGLERVDPEMPAAQAEPPCYQQPCDQVAAPVQSSPISPAVAPSVQPIQPAEPLFMACWLQSRAAAGGRQVRELNCKSGEG